MEEVDRRRRKKGRRKRERPEKDWQVQREEALPASQAAGVGPHRGRRQSRCRPKEKPASGHPGYHPGTHASHVRAFRGAWMGNGAAAITTKKANPDKTPTVCLF